MRTLILIFVAALGFLSSISAQADERSAALTNDFMFFCTVELPDFSRLNEVAKSLNLKVKSDLHPLMPPGQSARSKGWFMGDTTGTYELSVAESINGRKIVTVCGIGAPDALGTELRSDIVAKMHIGNPVQEEIIANGQMKTTTWKVLMGQEYMLLRLANAYPRGPGIYLSIAREVESKVPTRNENE